MQKTRNLPKIKIQKSFSDKVLETLGWVGVIVLWTLLMLNYNTTPDEVPIHFNLSGTADAYGGKLFLFFIPVVSTVLYVGITLLNRIPHTFNYPVKIDDTNAKAMYTKATRMMRFLKFSIVVVFGFIQYAMLSDEFSQRYGRFFIAILLVITVLPVGVFIVDVFRKRS